MCPPVWEFLFFSQSIATSIFKRRRPVFLRVVHSKRLVSLRTPRARISYSPSDGTLIHKTYLRLATIAPVVRI
jgi:hypothetical protein